MRSPTLSNSPSRPRNKDSDGKQGKRGKEKGRKKRQLRKKAVDNGDWQVAREGVTTDEKASSVVGVENGCFRCRFAESNGPGMAFSAFRSIKEWSSARTRSAKLKRSGISSTSARFNTAAVAWLALNLGDRQMPLVAPTKRPAVSLALLGGGDATRHATPPTLFRETPRLCLQQPAVRGSGISRRAVRLGRVW